MTRGSGSTLPVLDFTSLQLTRAPHPDTSKRIVVADVTLEQFPLARMFTISRGSKSDAFIVCCAITTLDGTIIGRGECVPYPRYGETPGETHTTLTRIADAAPMTIADLERSLSDLRSPAAANALDCALWDFYAKAAGQSVAEMIGLRALNPVPTFVTLSLAAPDMMAADATRYLADGFTHLKLKLGGTRHDDRARMHAVRDAAPDATLIADANEGWTADDLSLRLADAKDTGLVLVEQPLRADDDHMLAEVNRAVPVCADESAHTADGIAALAETYDAVNIKLDKTGGLTGALAAVAEARRAGMRVMVGSMVSTSLSMAPAMIAAQFADYADLDSPTLLAEDRLDGMVIRDGRLMPPSPGFWGT